MNPEFTITAPVKGGRLPKAVGDGLRHALQALEGKRARVTVAEAPKPRRPNKRRYYFSCVVATVCRALRDAGNVMDEEETHTFLKAEAGRLRKVCVLPTGEIKYTLRSYRDLQPREESDYLTACLAWAAQMGIEIPPPDTYHNQREGTHHD